MRVNNTSSKKKKKTARRINTTVLLCTALGLIYVNVNYRWWVELSSNSNYLDNAVTTAETILDLVPRSLLQLQQQLKEQPQQCQQMDDQGSSTGLETTKNQNSIKPIWIAGYPGSGNDMVRTLVKQLTGFDGRDVYLDTHCQIGTCATCKTHFPVVRRHPPNDLKSKFQQHVVLLLRNPANAMPSFFNYQWEVDNNIQDHSQQGPEDEWRKWRKKNFGRQIRFWKKLIKFWVQHEYYHVETILPYEWLTSKNNRTMMGVTLVEQLAKQLQKGQFDTVTDYDCQWSYCVHGGGASSVTKRAPHRYKPRYTAFQKSVIIKILNQTLDIFTDHPVLSVVVQQYLTDVQDHLLLEEEDDASTTKDQ